VVLVQGRGGVDAREKWSSLWPKDRVPKAVRGKLRVFGFEYSDLVNDDYRFQSVCWFAETLLQDLVNQRTDLLEETRPIAFIAHSTGGVIVKQASGVHGSNLGSGANFENHEQGSHHRSA
jgi:hypothetical protein